MFIIQTEPSIISAALKSLLRQIYGDGQKLSYETQTLTQPRYTLSKTMALRHRNIIRPPYPFLPPEVIIMTPQDFIIIVGIMLAGTVFIEFTGEKK
jgi:hypothetical protein